MLLNLQSAQWLWPLYVDKRIRETPFHERLSIEMSLERVPLLASYSNFINGCRTIHQRNMFFSYFFRFDSWPSTGTGHLLVTLPSLLAGALD